jgi:hypothetical protein
VSALLNHQRRAFAAALGRALAAAAAGIPRGI